jgi:hypothetical protein
MTIKYLRMANKNESISKQNKNSSRFALMNNDTYPLERFILNLWTKIKFKK